MSRISANWLSVFTSDVGPGLNTGGVPSMRDRLHEDHDRWLISVIALLLLIGMVSVYSARLPLPSSNALNPVNAWVHGHLRNVLVALFAGFVMHRIPTDYFSQYAGRLFLVGLSLLIVVCGLKLFGGDRFATDGAVRFLPLQFITLQPAELMKLFALFYAADYATRRADRLHSFKRGFIPIALAMAATSTLILYQPDLGSTMVIVAIVMSVLFLAGMNLRMFALLSVVLILFFVIMVIMTPWRLDRLLSYLTPCAPDVVKAKGYQLCGALIAFGHGSLFGSGLGTSIAKLGHLPLPHSDFIFAMIGEEFGFVGVVVVVAGFMFLTRRAFEIGRQAWVLERTFQGLVAQGIGVWVGLQALIHAGVNTGLLPTKGLTLPLISDGGSSLLATAMALGVLLRVDTENRRLMRGGLEATAATGVSRPSQAKRRSPAQFEGGAV